LLRNVCQSRGKACSLPQIYIFGEPLSNNGLFRVYSLPLERCLAIVIFVTV
jgi:hypothetical protein